MRWGLSRCTQILPWNLPSWRKSWDSEHNHTPSLKLKIGPLVKRHLSSHIWESTKGHMGSIQIICRCCQKNVPCYWELAIYIWKKETVNTSGCSCLRRIILSDDVQGRILPNGNQGSKLRLYKSGVSAIGKYNRDQRLPLPTHKSPMKGYKSSEQSQDQIEHDFPR